jgi:hypothetical protein
MIFTVMEVAKGMPNRLAWQGLRSYYQFSTTSAPQQIIAVPQYCLNHIIVIYNTAF